MRDDDDDDALISDDGDDLKEVSDVEQARPSSSEIAKNRLEARRKLERMKERKELRKLLGDDWSDDLLLDDDI
jgi:hypothetical protein